jgi:hypothetical protein
MNVVIYLHSEAELKIFAGLRITNYLGEKEMKRFQHTFFDFGLAVAIAGLALFTVGMIAEYYL